MDVATNTTISVSQAAKTVARPESTIRDWIKKSLIKHDKDLRGRLVIDRNSLLQHVQNLGHYSRQGATMDIVGNITNDKEQSLYISEILRSNTEIVQQLRDDLQHERQRNSRLEAQNQELQGEIIKVINEMKSLINKETGIMSWIRSIKN
jgi:hypothetical protein